MTTTHTVQRRPLACDLAALTAAERDRHATLWKRARAIAPEPTPTPEGLAFRFPNRPDLAHDLVELAMIEGRCCPFLRITFALEPGGDTLTLELGGDEEARELLTEVLPS